MNRYIYILLCVAGLAVVPAKGQKLDVPRLADSSIKLEQLKVDRTENNLVLKMSLNMDSLDLPSNIRLVFTPIVKSKEQMVKMPQIVVNGRKQDISYRRSGYKDFADDVIAVRRKNDTRQSVPYTAVLPYEDWMKNSNVEVAEDLCGCGDILDQNTVMLKKLRSPFMPYIHPKAEGGKTRYEKGRAFVDFPVDKITLYPEYRNNPMELNKIIQTINLVKNDKNVTITNINIHGYASPESPYDHNAYLAENRALTLKNYVRQLLHLEDSIFTVSSTPEDWAGLREYVVNSSLQHKKEILDLIDDQSLDLDAKEWRIKLTYPEDYRFMLETWYPALRHSDYVVTYSVRPFTVEEAKEILKTKPQQLSLEEMFMVAQTYKPGSADFNEVMEIAVRMFPDNEIANINAACARMESGDLAGAKKYLLKAGNSAFAWHAKGVLAMLEGNTEQAREFLNEAKKAGDVNAQKNLDILEL